MNILNRMNRGALICFEGCDRCGKSTQSKKLVNALNDKGIKTSHVSFPDRTIPSGKLIDSFLTNTMNLSDESIHLLFTLNRWELKNKMEADLKEGTTIIVDRYSYSGVAYSVAKGMDMEWCKGPERGLIKPDLVIYLDTNTEVLSKRGNFGSERYEKIEFQNKVAEIFKILGGEEKNYWSEIDADKPVDDLHNILLGKSLNVIEKIKNKPLEKLWS